MKAFLNTVVSGLKYVPKPFVRLFGIIKKGVLSIRPNKKYITRKWIVVYAACALAVGIGGYFLWVELTYQDAVRYTENGNYTQAAELSGKLPSFYKDSSQLQKYDRAGSDMEGSKFDEAKQAFSALGQYRNAQTLVKESDYRRAVSYLNRGDFGKAKETFAALGDYSDAQSMVMESDYRSASALLAAGQYADAKTAFQSLGSYKDAQTMLSETDYQKAQSQLATGDFAAAKQSFAELGAYKDSQSMVVETDYQKAQADYKNGNFEAAAAAFQTLGAYKDSVNMVLEANYSRAQDCIKKGDFAAAVQLFTSLGDFKDSKAMVTECTYQKAQSDLKAGNFGDAQKTFKSLGDYKDSKTMVTECSYRHAKALINDGSYLDAYDILSNLGGYADSEKLIANLQDSIYGQGVALYNKGNIDEARSCFEIVSDYSDSSFYIRLIDAQGQHNELGYQTLKSLEFFANAKEIMLSAPFLKYFLDGYWTAYGGYYLYVDASSYNASLDFNFYDDGSYYYHFEDSCLVSSLGNTILSFTFITDNTMRVDTYMDGTITMNRQ